MDASHNLYGTTEAGGLHGFGVVFRLTPGGTETPLYSFAGGSDGAYPAASLIMDGAGNLYGTTEAGGATASAPYSRSPLAAAKPCSILSPEATVPFLWQT